jgi:TolB-like protein/DNA-binding winged helix-turn-helix (wHTH) protein/lipopolysaccharide biosynthesis regulator YciM
MPAAAVKFDEFELDPAAFELRRKGRPVRLERIPLELLLLLVSRKGEVVSRAEIIDKLWGSDVYIDTNTAINVAVRKVRQALRDDPGNPQFLLTVPGKGYRFIGSVELLPDPLLAENAQPQPSTSSPVLMALPEPAETVESPQRSKRGWLLPAIVAGIVVFFALVLWSKFRQAPKAPGKRTMLVVLPFQNLSGDPGQEYIPDGLTEETITDLGQLSPTELGVIARTSAMAYKHTDKTVSQIGRELGIDYVLEGSVRSEGGKARVSAQLIRVSDQTHLWAKNYDRDLNNLLDIENELGKTIAQQVQLNLNPQRQVEMAKARSVDPEAYDLYLKGRYYWNQRTPPGIKQSIGYYQQAIAKSPDFAQAYAGLAAAYNFANIVGTFSEAESYPKAKEAALKAINLDPSIAEAHSALGMEKSLYEHDFVGAQEEFVKAIEANPNAAYAHLFYANCYLAPVGRMQEAVAENKKALELDPLSLPINNFMAVTYMGAGDFEASYRQFQHTIAMDPTFPLAHGYFSNLLVEMGRYEEAIQEWQKGKVLGGEEDTAAQAPGMLEAYKRGGAKAFWQLRLATKLEARKHPGAMPVSATEIAEIYARLNDEDKAFEWLNRAVDDRDGQDVIDLKCDPVYKNLREDPRYVALLRRMGLPE